MAALIHPCNNSTPATNPTTTSSSSSRPLLKIPLPSHIFTQNPLSRPPISLSFSKPELFPNTPSSPLKTPYLQNIFSPNLVENETPKPLSDGDLFRLLKLSIQYNDTQLSKAIHASVLKIQHNTHLFNYLITSYLQLDHLNYAQRVLNSILSPDVVSYTAMISGLAKSSREREAVRLFFEMRGSGIEPNEYTLVALLTASMRLLDVDLGSQVHAFSIKSGYVDCTFVMNALMGLYGKCGLLDLAAKLFDDMPDRDIASWNTVISCLVKEGMYDRAFELGKEMLRFDEQRVNYFTLSSLITSCARTSAMKRGTELHAYALKIGYGSNLSVNNALIEFYSKCGCLADVERLFERMPVCDTFTWHEMINAYMGFGLVDMAVSVFNKMPDKNFFSYNALLSGFCQNDDGFSAWRIFCRLLEKRMELTDFTLTTVLNACGLMRDKRISEQIHAFLIKFGFGKNDHIETALLHMCTRCGRMDDAEKIFRRFGKGNLIMLTSMVCGYARISEPENAISLICNRHYEEPFIMDEVALASTLSVCGDLGFKKIGEQFHCLALKYGLLSEIGVGNAMVSMYSNCGDIESAINFFDSMSSHDLVSWNGLLSGHIINRKGEEALATWQNMHNRGVKPDSITCHLVISAYRYTKSNLVENCREFFASMKSMHLIGPDSDHYACLVSVLGYWGFIEEAEEIIDNMPFEPNASIWRALLDSCRICGNATIGRRATKRILEMDPQDPSTYILKSNLYSASGMWHCTELVREEMRDRGFRKFPGRSWLIHENKIHWFFARDKSHSQCKDIYSALEILLLECLKAGYVPDTSFVLHEVEEHQKINFLLYHSVKLAVVYGILVSRPGKAVRVMKNIHMCGDCHAFLKCISVITKREIHVRDSSGFHCFANGECSCKG